MLDPQHAEFLKVVYINHRLVEGKDDRLHNQQWVFQDSDLATTFRKMDMGKRQDSNRNPQVFQDHQSTETQGKSLIDTDTVGIGRIVVKVKRVLLKGPYVEEEYRANLKEEDEEFGMKFSDSGISHRAGYVSAYC